MNTEHFVNENDIVSNWMLNLVMIYCKKASDTIHKEVRDIVTRFDEVLYINR